VRAEQVLEAYANELLARVPSRTGVRWRFTRASSSSVAFHNSEYLPAGSAPDAQ